MLTFASIQESTGASLQNIVWNTRYLEEAGFIEISKVLAGSEHYKAKIKSYGIELIEDESEYNQKFPLKIEQNININNSSFGHIQGQGSISGDIQNGQTLFAMLIKGIENSTEINTDEKITLLQKIKDFSSHPVIANILSGLGMKVLDSSLK